MTSATPLMIPDTIRMVCIPVLNVPLLERDLTLPKLVYRDIQDHTSPEDEYIWYDDCNEEVEGECSEHPFTIMHDTEVELGVTDHVDN